MIPFQIILLSTVVLLNLFIYKRYGNSKRLIILLVISTVTISYFVCYPDETTVIANILGIRRGTDMLLYCSVMFFTFLILKIYIKMKKIESKITVMIREKSLSGEGDN